MHRCSFLYPDTPLGDGDSQTSFQKQAKGLGMGNTVHLHIAGLAAETDGDVTTLSLNQAAKGDFAEADPGFSITRKEGTKTLSFNAVKNLIDAYKAGYDIAAVSFVETNGQGLIVQFDNGKAIDEVLLNGSQVMAWLAA